MAKSFPHPSTSWLLALPLAMSLSGHAPALAQTAAATPPLPTGSVIEYHPADQTMTVHVASMPLRQLLDAVTAQTAIHFRPPAPMQAFDNRPITRSFDRMPMERAIKQLLGPSNTAMIYGAQQTASRHGDTIVIREVRVIDLGVIPITASTADPNDGRGESAATSNTRRFTPEELQARREAQQQKRADKSGRGGRSGKSNPRNQNQATPTDTSSSKDPAAPQSDNASKSPGQGKP